MTLATCLQSFKTRFDGNQPRRSGRRPASHKPARARPRMEPLEERQLLSGFGPADGAYITEAIHGGFGSVKIQPTDQKIVAAGTAVVGRGPGVAIARYDSVGNTDSGYGNGGMVTLAGPNFSGFILQSDGKAVVTSNLAYDFRLDRLNGDGSPDASFGNGGSTVVNIQPGSDQTYAVGLQSTGKIVVAGSSASSTTTPTNQSYLVARFGTSGTLDSGTGGFGKTVRGTPVGYRLTSFGGVTQGYGAVVVQPDDKLVAAGVFYANGGNAQLVVARYTASGTLDGTFNGKGYSMLALAGFSVYARAVVLQPDGKIVIVGTSYSIDTADDIFVSRFNSDGTLDTSFAGGSGYEHLDNGGNQAANGVAIQPDGKIVVAGTERALVPGYLGNVLVARLNTDGTLDTSFGTSGFKHGYPLAGTGYHDFHGYGLALESDGSIIVAGIDYWGTTAGTQHPLLMRFFGTTPALLAASSPTGTPATETLTVGEVKPLVNKAIAYWQAHGADTSHLGNVDIAIADLGGATLGLASGHTITLDDNAAGWGWNVGRSAGRGRKALSGRMDLLSALTHEVGHLLGHNHAESGVMAETLAPGVRQALPVDSTHGHAPTILARGAVPSRVGSLSAHVHHRVGRPRMAPPK